MSSSSISKALQYFRNTQTPVHLFFMRHGQSIANKTNTFQGRSNSELSETGEGQAAASGTYFSQYNLDTVYSSPLIRANKTARIVTQELGLDPKSVEVLDELQELDTGVFSDRSIDYIRNNEPELWNTYQQHSWDGVPEAEGQLSLRVRALSIWRLLAKVSADGKRSILCVSHGGIMQWIIKSSFTDTGVWMPLVEVSNCGIFHMHIRPINAEDAILATWRAFNHTVH